MKPDKYPIEFTTMMDVQTMIEEILDFVDKCGQPDKDGYVRLLLRNEDGAGNNVWLTPGEIENFRKFIRL